MPYPATLGQRPLEVREAYAALEQYATDYGREALLLLMHASLPEMLRADLLNLIRVNFLPGRSADLSLEADVLFSPLATGLGGGYYRLDAQVRWHCLALLRSLYRDDTRARERRVAELLWRYVQATERRASRAADPQLAEFLDIQRWVALAYLEPANAAHAFADALRQAAEAPASALLRLGGLTSAIEMPLANEQELLSYAKAMDALVSGDDERAKALVEALGENEIRVGSVVLKAPTMLLAQRQPRGVAKGGGEPEGPVPRRKSCFVLIASGRQTDFTTGQVLDLDQSYNMIREAVTGLDMDCLRLDEVRSPGPSGHTIYEHLLDADLVVCDLSAHDLGVTYLLGVCWVLRPSGTLVIAERGYRNADHGFTSARWLSYEPHGDEIGVEEGVRFADRLRSITAEPDSAYLRSPVYGDYALIPPHLLGDNAPAELSMGAAQRKGGGERCLVLQGFGRQTDAHTGRTLDLDASYEIIREAVDSLGLECIRFGVVEPGLIDGPMFRLLHEAELVVGDLSAGADEVLLELGIRFGLCPSRTLLVAEEQCRIPGELAELYLLRYKHLGDDVGSREASRFRSELGRWIKEVLTTRAIDSPVYLALPPLRPPMRRIDHSAEDAEASRSEAPPDTFEKPSWASASGSDEYGRHAEINIGGVKQRFCWIEPGSFVMGSPTSERERSDDEAQHPVTLSRGFWLADTACTQALWQAVTGANPSRFKDDPRNPVERVSWDEAQEFISQLNRGLSGLHARLPSEAEWEYACRAGTTTPFSFGDNIAPDQVNCNGDHPYAGGDKGLYRGRTVPVGSLPPNAWRLYEMHGNVWEWCDDWYGAYARGTQLDPKGPQTGAYRALRGGSWDNSGRYVRSASRSRNEPGYRSPYIGFRLALGQGQPAEPA